MNETIGLRRAKFSTWVMSSGNWVLALNVALLLAFGAASAGLIWSPRAIESMLMGSTQGILLALGLAMLLGSGNFDLSLGANLVLSSITAALTIKAVAADSPVAVAILLGLLVSIGTGALFGSINGVLIAYLKINSLIATLATMGIGTGLALLISSGSDVISLPREMQTWFGQASVSFIPVPVLVAVAVAVTLWAVLRFTVFGSRTLAIGSSSSAAERSGISVRPHIVTLAALAGSLAGLAGFVEISRYGSTALAGHSTDALAAVTAAVIGGTLLTGGKVNIAGTVWGALLAVILQTGLIVIGVPAFWQLIAIGTVLIIAVSLSELRTSRSRHP